MKLFLRSIALVLAALLSAPATAGEFRQISQIIDSSGNPVVNGYIYIGTYALDPVTNPISLFSDSALSVPIANPVRTDSYGRPTTDIFFSQSQYSYTLKTSALVTIEGPKNRDAVPTAASVASNQAGTATSCGTFGGSANALTCTLSPAITAYTDLMAVRGRIASDNTGTVTLSINGVGTRNVVKYNGTPLASGELQANDTHTFVFDTTNNRFMLQSPPMGEVTRADVASAATVNLDTVGTQYVRVTGTTTITAITLSDGRSRAVVFGGALTLTNGASLILPGGANITTAAGDTAIFVGEPGGVVRCLHYGFAALAPEPSVRLLGHSAVANTIGNSTAETTLATVTVPAGAMGANGRLRVKAFVLVNINANVKTLRVRFSGASGTAHFTGTVNSVASGIVEVAIANKNATNSQGGHWLFGKESVGAMSSSTESTSAVDTTAATTVVISGQKDVLGDTFTLQSYSVELLK